MYTSVLPIRIVTNTRLDPYFVLVECLVIEQEHVRQHTKDIPPAPVERFRSMFKLWMVDVDITKLSHATPKA